MNLVLKSIYLASLLFLTSVACVYASPVEIETESYVVSKGDTLFSLAARHGISIRELKKINGLKNARLKVGEVLLVPFIEKNEAISHQEDEVSALIEGIEEIAESGDAMEFSNKVLETAKDLLGTPYRFGGNSLKGIDCSAYVKKVFAALNIELPRSAREQFHVGEKVSKEELTPGDLVFFKTYARYPSHVGIFIGENKFIHASSKGRKVGISNLDAPYYARRFIGAKRLNLDL